MAVINFPDSPSDGATQTVGGITYTYSSTKGYWTAAASSGGGGGGGSSVTTDDSAPTSPSDGDLWYDTAEGGMFVYYEDTDSSQWVEVIGSQGADGAAGADGADGADGGAGVASVYATIDLLPLSGNTQGDMAHVTGNNTLYFWNGSGWYKIALINTSPSISGVSSSYDLAIDGTATTVTITATDPEGLPITYSIASDTSGNIATVAQGTGSNTNVFTITPSTNTAHAGTFSLTFRASDGVNIATAPATFTLTFGVTNSNYTTALITTAGSAGTNSAFTDSSSNSHTITANGNVHQSSFSPYRSGGYSTYFPGPTGTAAYLTTPSAAISIGTGDFTYEAWIYDVIGDSSWRAIISPQYNANGIGFFTVSGRLSAWGSGELLVGPTFSTNEWHHVALTRESGTLYMYLNGVKHGTSVANSYNLTNSTYQVGANGAGGETFYGYIADARVVNGNAIYTANFTPPETRLTAITNTSLLTCHLPYFADGSTNNHTITPSGDISTKPFAPYEYKEYTVGEHGGSAYFDGTGDYLDVTSSAANLGTGDFTVECWAYWSADPRSIIYDTRQSDGNSGHAIFMTSTTHNVVFYDNNATVLTSAGAVKQGIWNHIAVVRNSGTINIFINGKKDTAQVTGNTTNFDAHTFRIGEKTYGGIPNVTGNITDFRISSTARYTADFTPATTALTSDGNTSLLLGMQGAKILDKSQSTQTLTLAGNTTASTAQYKYLPTSMYFDGTGDYLTVNHDALGTGDWTIEGWVYFNTISSQYIFDFRSGSNTNPALNIEYDSVWGNDWRYISDANYRIQSGITPSANTWYHFAIVKNNGTTTLYINGSSIGTYSDSLNYVGNSAAQIGKYHNSGAAYLDGYLSDFRITKGLARYTANFTPPSAALEA